ncbi:MAG TPA: RNA polymerase sigma-70 factor [Chitinophagaceae bacterium]
MMQQGNEQGLTELYQRYYASLCLKAYQRIPSTPLVEEIVQDVFVNIWIKAVSLDIKGNVRAYLYATLRNKILHELRTAQTRSFYAEKIRQLMKQQVEDHNLDAIYIKETETQINQIISTLSPQCKETFLLSRYEHLAHKEIAARMGISVSTVEKHIAKALRILRNGLREYGDVAFMGSI